MNSRKLFRLYAIPLGLVCYFGIAHTQVFGMYAVLRPESELESVLPLRHLGGPIDKSQ